VDFGAALARDSDNAVFGLFFFQAVDIGFVSRKPYISAIDV
jgi:hypothetical protein